MLVCMFGGRVCWETRSYRGMAGNWLGAEWVVIYYDSSKYGLDLNEEKLGEIVQVPWRLAHMNWMFCLG